MYYLHNGNTATRAQIAAAVKANKARLIHGYAGGPTLSIDGEDLDTRGCTYPNGVPIEMSAQTWTTVPTLHDALYVAGR